MSDCTPELRIAAAILRPRHARSCREAFLGSRESVETLHDALTSSNQLGKSKTLQQRGISNEHTFLAPAPMHVEEAPGRSEAVALPRTRRSAGHVVKLAPGERSKVEHVQVVEVACPTSVSANLPTNIGQQDSMQDSARALRARAQRLIWTRESGRG